MTQFGNRAPEWAYLDLVFPLLVDPLLCFCSLLVVLDFADNGLDFDLGQRAGETGVEREIVVRPDIPPLGVLRQDPKLAAGQ
jgi:hypothetical protein